MMDLDFLSDRPQYAGNNPMLIGHLKNRIAAWEKDKAGQNLTGSGALHFGFILTKLAALAVMKISNKDEATYKDMVEGRITTVKVVTNNYGLAWYGLSMEEQVLYAKGEFDTIKTKIESLRRRVILQRKKFTAQWLDKDGNPTGQTGFPLIVAYRRTSRRTNDGNPVYRTDGRGNIELDIDLQYVFGHRWSPAAPMTAQDAAPASTEAFFRSIVKKVVQIPK